MNILCFICAVPTTICILLAINGFFFNLGKVLTDQCAWLPLHSCFFVTHPTVYYSLCANFHIILFYNTGLLEQWTFLKILFLFLFSVMTWQFFKLTHGEPNVLRILQFVAGSLTYHYILISET